MDLKDIKVGPKPYMVRAIWQWLVDIGDVPDIHIDTSVHGVDVPVKAIHEGKFVLNSSPRATSHLDIGNEMTNAGITIGGRHFNISFPTEAICGIVGRHTKYVLGFDVNNTAVQQQSDVEPILPPQKPTKSKSHLTVVK